MKNFKVYFLLLIISSMLLNVSCSSKTSAPQDQDAPQTVQDEVLGLDEIKEIEEQIVLEEDDANKVISPLDGLKYYPEELMKRPVAVSLDNHPNARWQAGLKDAEIVYEFEVEFPYTRYLAVYLAKEPKQVGPVRSARPYIIYYALENDAIFVHVGGSEDAFSEIKRLEAPDIDGLYSGAMWRYTETGKYAPHNMYTTLKSIRDEAERKGFKTEGNIIKYNFNEKNEKLSLKYETSIAKTINITYNKENTTKYVYNQELLQYMRFKDGEKHIDELDKEQLKAKNIIVLEAPKSVLDNAGRLYMETIGKGIGIYFTEGEACEITWSKESEKDRTKFFINNKELSLNPGNTWVQIVNSIDCVIAE